METQPLLPCKTATSKSNVTCSAQSHSPIFGLAWITLAAILVAIPSVAGRLAITRYAFPASAMVLVRCFVQLLLSSISLFGFLKVSPLDLTPFHRTILFVRGLCGTFALIFVYASLTYLPAGVTTAITAFSPVLTMVLSRVFLKETSSAWDILCALIGICGVLLIAGPNASKQDVLGVVLAFLAASFAAAAYVCVRGMGTRVHFMLSVFALAAIGFPTATIYGGKRAFEQIANNHIGVAVALVGSLAGFLAQCCLNKGLQLCKAGEGIIVKNAQVPSAYILGILILNEKPSFVRIMGSMLVVSAAITVGVRRLMAK